MHGAVCTLPVHCPVGTQNRYQTLCVSLAAVWRHYDVGSSIEEDSKRYHQNFLFCNNNEITACIADLFSSFCEAVCAVAFFKVVQQQTIGKVGNSVICLWADNFCLQVWKKVIAVMKKGPVFLTHSVVYIRHSLLSLQVLHCCILQSLSAVGAAEIFAKGGASPTFPSLPSPLWVSVRTKML